MDLSAGRRLALSALPFLSAAPIIAAWALWAHDEGAYFAGTWYPSAIAFVLIAVVTAASVGRALPASRWAQTALACLAGLMAWHALSMLWSDSAATGWDSVNKLILVLAVAWAVSLLPWTARSATVALGAWVLGVAAVCAISLAGASGAENLGDYFAEGRYLDPLGYPNAAAALPAMAFFPALAIAARRGTPVPLQVLFLTVAVLLFEFALLPQSRGSFTGLAVAIPVFVALAPDRLRLIPAGLVIAGATVLSIGPIYEVYDVGTELTGGLGRRALGPVMDNAAAAIALTTALAALVACLLAACDRFARPSARMVRSARQAVAALLLVIAVGGLALAGANSGSIKDEASERWETLKSGDATPPRPGARITASYSDLRFDYWRVAVDAFQDRPLAGIGAGAYEDRYSAERREYKPSRYTHDLWLRILAETGITGIALLLGFLAAALGGIAWLGRRADASGSAIAAACLAPSLYFFVHSSFDWLDEFPALLSPALALPLIGLIAMSGSPPPSAARAPLGLRRAGWAATVSVAAAAVLSLLPPYLAMLHVDRATRTWPQDARAAFRDLDRAAALNPLSPRPHLRAAAIALRIEDQALARAEFRSSIEVEDNWYARMELALLEAQAGRFGPAAIEIRRAGQLNSRDVFVFEAAAAISGAERVDPLAFNQRIRAFNRQRFTRPIE